MFRIMDTKSKTPQKILSGNHIAAARKNEPPHNYSRRECVNACKKMKPAVVEHLTFTEANTGTVYVFDQVYRTLKKEGEDVPECTGKENEPALETVLAGKTEPLSIGTGEERKDYPAVFHQDAMETFLETLQYWKEQAPGREQELSGLLGALDKRLCDLSHIIELYDLADGEGAKVLHRYKEDAMLRRFVKDELDTIRLFHLVADRIDNQTVADVLLRLKRRDERSYMAEYYQPEMFIDNGETHPTIALDKADVKRI